MFAKGHLFTAYGAALASYAGTALFFWPRCLLLLALSLAVAGNWAFWPMVLLSVSFIAGCHACFRLGSYRGRLVPGYRDGQLAALATFCLGTWALLSIAMVLLTPSVIPRFNTAGQRILPDVANVDSAVPMGLMILACAAGCLLVRAKPLYMVVVAAMMSVGISLFLQHGPGRFPVAPAYLRIESLDLSLAAAGLVLFALTYRWLWNLTEEQAPPIRRATPRSGRAASVPWDFNARDFSGRTLSPGSWQARVNDIVLTLRDRRLDAALARGSAVFGWNVRRWLQAWPLTDAALQLVPLMVGLTWLWSWMLCVASPSGFTLGSALFIIPQMVWIFFPRRNYLAIESLRPATRGQFFRQQGVGMLAQWLTTTALIVGSIWLGSRGEEFSFAADLRRLVGWAAVVLAVQLTVFAGFAWGFRSGSWGTTALIVGMATAGSVVLADASHWAQQFSVWWPLAIAAMVAACGAALLSLVYRRWLVTDLD